MQFNVVRKEVEGVVFDKLRVDSDNHFEAVIVKNELANLTVTLQRLFGSPAWPSQKRLLPRIQKIIKSFGGIRPGQALYFWSQGKDTIFAMLWPWEDGYHTTVKIIRE
ncbi:MAG: hypothetical protein Q8R31_02885 [Candidatus Omnitrophota bacterium]|nr:hypothetical protein [Candidatus Omnitrophota bacterium]